MRYRRLASVTLNVADPARSRPFYAALPGGGAGIELAAGTPGLKRVAFEVESAACLDKVTARFDHAGVRWAALGPDAIRFVAPYTGMTVDLTLESGPAHALGHLVIRSAHYRDSVEFWRATMGFRLSDEIDGRISFLRCFPNPLHHSLAIAKGDRTGFHHLNFRAGDADELASYKEALSRRDVPILCGPARHTPTGNRFLFFADPDGLTLEISAGTEYFDEHAPRPARLLPDRPESFDDGTSPRDPRMFTIGQVEDARKQNEIGV